MSASVCRAARIEAKTVVAIVSISAPVFQRSGFRGVGVDTGSLTAHLR